MPIDDVLLDTLKLANLRGTLSAGVTRPLSAGAVTVGAHGVAPGREVVDTVTGQRVIVITSGTAYLSPNDLPR